jgi:hypothetical protein
VGGDGCGRDDHSSAQAGGRSVGSGLVRGGEGT